MGILFGLYACRLFVERNNEPTRMTELHASCLSICLLKHVLHAQHDSGKLWVRLLHGSKGELLDQDMALFQDRQESWRIGEKREVQKGLGTSLHPAY